MNRDLRGVLEEIYTQALEAVEPEGAVLRFLQRTGDEVQFSGRTHPLAEFRRVFLVGFGKAALPMARAVEELLGDRLETGLVVVKYGYGGALEKTTVLEAGHPEPDAAGLAGASRLLEMLDSAKLSNDDLLIVLISGGGSALVPAPVTGISLAEKKEATSLLLRSGASIHEMNCIRKHLSRIKGGRLLEHAGHAAIWALMLSDVVGDDLSTIASGPTVPDPTTYADCLGIIRKYSLESSFPPAALEYLAKGAAGDPGAPETLKPGEHSTCRVENVIVGSNLLGLQAAAGKSAELGFAPVILSSSIEGDTAEVARLHVALAREVLSNGNPVPPPCCLISGGETTVNVRGDGKGGRNQEFALCCAREVAGWGYRDLLFASLGSDGTDGPTDAAGAFADPETETRGARLGLSLGDHLARNDSYHFFKPLGDLIVTGPTRTNVMDFRFVLIG